MAHWRINVKGNMVYLRHAHKEPQEARDSSTSTPQGQGGVELQEALFEWVCDIAQQYDLIHTPSGVFTRQVAPSMLV